jgi:hypothetical protein
MKPKGVCKGVYFTVLPNIFSSRSGASRRPVLPPATPPLPAPPRPAP